MSSIDIESPKYKRVVVKLGTRVLTKDTDQLNLEVMNQLVDQIANLHVNGLELLLVTSGAIAAGREVLGVHQDRKDIPDNQILAAVGQSRLMHIYQQIFEMHHISVAQALLTRRDIADRQGYLNIRNTLNGLLEHRVIPVINENDVVTLEELNDEAFGDNDRLSAMVSNLVDADLLIMLTDTQGFYSADPDYNPDAELIDRVDRLDESIEALAGRHRHSWARGGMPAKLEAARLATSLGTPVVIACGWESNVIVRLINGEALGTYFITTASKIESKKRWMLSGLAVRGEIQIDNGAVSALQDQNRSLLPAGVQQILGDFQRGDTVYVKGPDGEKLACGISQYSAKELEQIKGCRSSSIEDILGYHYGAEVIHRNNLALL